MENRKDHHIMVKHLKTKKIKRRQNIATDVVQMNTWRLVLVARLNILSAENVKRKDTGNQFVSKAVEDQANMKKVINQEDLCL